MFRFSANVGMLFTELPFHERFAAARAIGFPAVEYPYTDAVSPTDLADLLATHGLEQSLANMPYEVADLGLAAVPGREDEFARRFDGALEYAHAAGCKALHVLAGRTAIDIPAELRDDTLMGNLVRAASQAQSADVTLVIEAINRRDVPDFALSDVHHAARIVEMVGLKRVKLLLDIYHVGTVGEDVRNVIRKYGSLIGYVQIAGVQRRNEPDDGAENYREILALLTSGGYRGYIGCEYRPRASTTDGLKWIESLQRSPFVSFAKK